MYDYYLIFARSCDIVRYFIRNSYLNSVSRQSIIYISEPNLTYGINKAKIILLYGWRSRARISEGVKTFDNYEPIVENLIRLQGCVVIGDFDEISKHEKKRFEIMRNFYFKETNQKPKVTFVNKYQLMILDD